MMMSQNKAVPQAVVTNQANINLSNSSDVSAFRARLCIVLKNSDRNYCFLSGFWFEATEPY